jgi:uncharacterized protein YegP (UPF0339 family)
MSARFEVVHTGANKFHARFVAANGETVWVTESFTRRRAASDAILILTNALDREVVEVRLVDER